MSLKDLRDRLDVIDRELLNLIAERQAVGAKIAKEKQSAGVALRDFSREREVIVQARAAADSLGVSPQMAESRWLANTRNARQRMSLPNWRLPLNSPVVKR